MEIFGGFMMMVTIIGFFLTVLWFVLPFVIFGIKGKVDRSVELLEQCDRRLAELERRLASVSAAALPLPSACAARPDNRPAVTTESSAQE